MLLSLYWIWNISKSSHYYSQLFVLTLSHNISHQAKDSGQLENKWLMINIQNVQDFACQCLNRDVWSNDAVKTIIREHFIFWQVNNLHRHECLLSLYVAWHDMTWIWAVELFRQLVFAYRFTMTARKARGTFSFTSLTNSPIFLSWTPVQVRHTRHLHYLKIPFL